ncbi:MAG: hypothetical protein ACRDPT_05170 [Streptomycetales bacterium]
MIDYATKYCLAATVTATSRGADALGCLRRAVGEAECVLDLDDLRGERGRMDVVDGDDFVIGEAPAPIAVVTDNGPCAFAGFVFAERSPATNRCCDTPVLYRATIGDGNALVVEVNLFRHTYNSLRPYQALHERTPRAAYLAVEHRG